MRRNASVRIAAARRQKNTPIHVRRLIRQYDYARNRSSELQRELREHQREHCKVYQVGNRLSSRVYHFQRRECMLRKNIGSMCIAGVPLVDRFRLAPDDDDASRQNNS